MEYFEDEALQDPSGRSENDDLLSFTSNVKHTAGAKNIF